MRGGWKTGCFPNCGQVLFELLIFLRPEKLAFFVVGNVEGESGMQIDIYYCVAVNMLALENRLAFDGLVMLFKEKLRYWGWLIIIFP